MSTLQPATSRIYFHSCLLALANYWIFHKYEPTRFTFFPTLALLLLEPLTLSVLSASTSNVDIVHSLITAAKTSTTAIVYVVFYATLSASIILYRISPFHPLAKIPGPVMFKISKLWAVWKFRSAKHHLILKQLHDIYGPVIRIGPNDVSVIETDAINTVLGASGLPKGSSYIRFRDPNEYEHMPKSLIILSGDQHRARRRLWNRAMSTESLKAYQTVISVRAQQMVERLETEIKVSEGRGVDLGQWLNYFAFDVMSDIGFGGGSDMLKEGADKYGRWGILTTHISLAYLLSQLPWLPRFFDSRIPWLARRTSALPNMARQFSMKRISEGALRKDIWYHLMDEAGLEKEKPTIPNVAADAILTIIAGADTTSVTLTTLFWLLLSHPQCYKRAQKEVDSVYPAGSDVFDVSQHSELRYIEACINECLRLFPAVPVGGSREVSSGGKLVAGHFLPERTQIYLPAYALHRDPRYFSPRTDEFVPDRWLAVSEDSESSSTPDAEKYQNDLKAFIPFSYGPSNCAGKNLAKQEMLMVVSLLLQRFEFEFEDGFDAKGWEDSLGSLFVTFRGPLRVCVRLR